MSEIQKAILKSSDQFSRRVDTIAKLERENAELLGALSVALDAVRRGCVHKSDKSFINRAEALVAKGGKVE